MSRFNVGDIVRACKSIREKWPNSNWTKINVVVTSVGDGKVWADFDRGVESWLYEKHLRLVKRP